ncbi:hypothetical protein PG984_005604 [Apiospora sp. TS-2023a]
MSDLTFSVGALTTNFTPTVTSCSSVYIQDNSAGTYFLKFGTVGPASTSSCYPPNFAPLGYYSPGCLSLGVLKYRSTDDYHQCESGFDRASYISVSQCYTKSGTPLLPSGRFVTTSYTSGDHIFAYGVNVRRASGDPVWSGEPGDPPTLSTTASSISSLTRPSSSALTRTRDSDGGDAGLQSSSASSSPGEVGALSSGTKIGIGVGVALGALLIFGSIAAAYLIGKRSRRGREEEDEARLQAKIQDQAYVADVSHQETGQKWTTAQHVAELPSSGYEGSTAYGSSESAAHYFNQPIGSTNNRPWVCEIGPSERSPVEMGSFDPSSELASRWQTSRELDTSPRPPMH